MYFVLGGIAVNGSIDFDDLLKYVGASQVPTDYKFSFFVFKKNKFEEAIKQSRLRKFFEYLLKKIIPIHFNVLHYMHFALTDILDSLIEEKDVNQSAAMFYYKQLQSDMTEVLYQDYNSLHNVWLNMSFQMFPKTGLIVLLTTYNLYTNNYDLYDSNDPKHFTKELLRQIIKAKSKKNNLLFLENNKPFVISDGAFHVYLNRAIEIADRK